MARKTSDGRAAQISVLLIGNLYAIFLDIFSIIDILISQFLFIGPKYSIVVLLIIKYHGNY